MRIHFFDQYKTIGGGQQVLLALVAASLRLGFATRVFAPSGGSLEQGVLETGAGFHSIPPITLTQGKKSWRDILRLVAYSFRLFLQTRRAAKEADILYINGARCLPFALLMQYVYGCKLVFHVHLKHSRLEKRLIQFLLRQENTLAIVVPSQYIYDMLIAFSPQFADKKVLLLENGLGSRYSGLPFYNRFQENGFTAVAITGRISPEKGHDILYALAPQFPELTFHVLGNPSFATNAYAKQLEASLPANVVFHGWIEDLPAFMATHNIQAALIPSRVEEAFGLAAIESMACSLVTIVRNTGGLQDIAASCRCLTFGSDMEVAPILRKLLATDTTQLAELAQTQHSLSLLHYSHEHFAQSLQDALQSFAAKV